MDQAPEITSAKSEVKAGHPAIYSGTFQVEQPGDVFLDMHGWGKGIVFVNGYNLGRYWKVGPQQTLYLPGCWLLRGNNKVDFRTAERSSPNGTENCRSSCS